MQIARFITLLAVGLAIHAQAAPVNLVDLTPTKIEFGMTEAGNTTWGLAKGPGVIDLGSWGGPQQMPWPDARKIVKGIKPNFKFEEGKQYSSFLPDVVAVAGDFKSGVCLLAMSNCMYYWLDYTIPLGSKKFSAKIYTTDDVSGGGRLSHIASGQATANRGLIIRITADKETIYEKHYDQMDVPMGVGVLIDTLDITLPIRVKTIRFYLESNTAPSNLHNEIVISGGKFE
ncbi:MAG: hypothetical protein WCS70_14860 [Verrucomicrobiota bacterium]